MRRLMMVAICIGALVAACDDSSTTSESSLPKSSPTFPFATAILEGEGDPVLLTVEVAETPEQHQRGLMFRESLPEDTGMVFIFFEDTSTGFWMKNTLIPLSIAFFDEAGRILEILDMEPCRRDPCRLYGAGLTYRGALEVEQGAFERWGISEGDLITIRR